MVSSDKSSSCIVFVCCICLVVWNSMDKFSSISPIQKRNIFETFATWIWCDQNLSHVTKTDFTTKNDYNTLLWNNAYWRPITFLTKTLKTENLFFFKLTIQKTNFSIWDFSESLIFVLTCKTLNTVNRMNGFKFIHCIAYYFSLCISVKLFFTEFSGLCQLTFKLNF